MRRFAFLPAVPVLVLATVSLVFGAPPAVHVVSFDAAPTIDGRLDDDVWTRAAVLSNFVQTYPGDNTPPRRETEVLVGYDSESLYLGIRAADDPARVRATVAKRDDVLDDDTVRIYLDTFGDRRRAYVLVFNPLGVQQDGVLVEGSEPDYSVDVVMESKGAIDGGGYTIEVAIPLRSLRYDAHASWGVHVVRTIKHLDEEDSWMPIVRGRAGFLDQAGRIEGFEGLASGRTIELIPSLTVSEAGVRTRGGFVNMPAAADLGLTAKVGLTPNVTLDAAVNPDFAQVEADEFVVTANQRFPIFFEEKRPFFLEGVEVFQTPIRAVHTRTIVDPDVAVKLSGKLGGTTFGLLAASDAAPGNFSDDELSDPALRPVVERFLGRNATVGVARLKQDVGEGSHVGLIATSYDLVDRHNRVAGVDARLRLDTRTVLTLQALGTSSRALFFDPDRGEDVYRTGNGFGYVAKLERTGRHLSVTATGEGLSPRYRADVGFTTQTNVNTWSVLTRYDSEKEDAPLVSWSALHTALARFDWQGRMKYTYLYPRVLLNFKRQTYLNVHAYRDYLRLFEDEFGARRSADRPGAFFGDEARKTIYKGILVEAGTAPTEKYAFRIAVDRAWDAFDYDFGGGPRFPRVSPAALADPNAPLDPGLGSTLDITATFDWQPVDATRVSLGYVRSRLVRSDTNRLAFDQRLYSVRATHQFTRFAFARARLDYDSARSNVRTQLLAGWSPNPGTAVYLGYDDDLNRNGFDPFTGSYEPGVRRNGRTFFVKLSYLVRVAR